MADEGRYKAAAKNIQPDFFDINRAATVSIKSSENPAQLILSCVQLTNVVCLDKNLV